VEFTDTGKAGLIYERMCGGVRCALVILYTWCQPRCCNPSDFPGFSPSPIPCEPGEESVGCRDYLCILSLSLSPWCVAVASNGG